jgi:hypothetical protein
MSTKPIVSQSLSANPINIILQIDGRLKIATYPDQLNYLTNQEQVLGFALPSAAHLTVQKCWAKTVLLSQTGMF